MNRIPYGCDQQGRHPEAAECCTEIGADDYSRNDSVSMRFLIAVLATAAAMGLTIALAWWIQ